MMQMSSDHKKNLVPESRASAIVYDELGLRKQGTNDYAGEKKETRP